jgi:hypothetical protein
MIHGLLPQSQALLPWVEIVQSEAEQPSVFMVDFVDFRPNATNATERRVTRFSAHPAMKREKSHVNQQK